MTERKIALSIEEAADYTGIGRNTLRKLVEWKKLPVLKVGRKVLIKTDILEKFMEANEGRPYALTIFLYQQGNIPVRHQRMVSHVLQLYFQIILRYGVPAY